MATSLKHRAEVQVMPKCRTQPVRLGGADIRIGLVLVLVLVLVQRYEK